MSGFCIERDGFKRLGSEHVSLHWQGLAGSRIASPYCCCEALTGNEALSQALSEFVLGP